MMLKKKKRLSPEHQLKKKTRTHHCFTRTKSVFKTGAVISQQVDSL